MHVCIYAFMYVMYFLGPNITINLALDYEKIPEDFGKHMQINPSKDTKEFKKKTLVVLSQEKSIDSTRTTAFVHYPNNEYEGKYLLSLNTYICIHR